MSRDRARRRRSRSPLADRRRRTSRSPDARRRRSRSPARATTTRRRTPDRRRDASTERRARRRSQSRDHRPTRAEAEQAGGGEVEWDKAIPGYSDMTSGEKVRARLKHQLAQVSQSETAPNESWVRPEFNSAVPLLDVEDAAGVRLAGPGAVSDARSHQHQAAIYGDGAAASLAPKGGDKARHARRKEQRRLAAMQQSSVPDPEPSELAQSVRDAYAEEGDSEDDAPVIVNMEHLDHIMADTPGTADDAAASETVPVQEPKHVMTEGLATKRPLTWREKAELLKRQRQGGD